jgi:hypothetical protein
LREISRSTLAVLGLALPFVPAAAQDRPPVTESVDLTVPFVPSTVRIDGRTHLVYELHITNLLSVPVNLSRLQVVARGTSRSTLADLRDTTLSLRLARPGPRAERATPRTIGAGLRAIANLWIAMPEGSLTPRVVKHVLDLEVARPTGTVPVSITGAESRVSTTVAPTIHPPLRGGPWGAIYDPLLVGGHRTVTYTIGGKARIPGRFAIDFVKLAATGAMDTSRTARPRDWNGYGAEVLAVADGVVAAAMDDVDDNPTLPGAPGPTITLANASGNYVALDIGSGRIAFYEHLQRGSVAVKTGDRVKRGQTIGRLGNSGSSSIGPHLHFHLADSTSLLGAEGIPFVFTQFDRIGAFRSIEAIANGETYLASPARVRRNERPDPNAVVNFK